VANVSANALETRYAEEDRRAPAQAALTNFARGLFHGAVEDIVNGPVQVINHAVGVDLPELHVVDTERMSASKAGRVGEMIGQTIDMAAVLLAFKGFGKATGILSSGLRSAAVGAVYGGVFQPTDSASPTFFADRAKNAFISGSTFGAMSAASAAINIFPVPVPGVRSLPLSMALGGLSGAVGGLAHAEATAITEGHEVPDASSVYRDIFNYATIGSIAGGGEYFYNRATLPPARKMGDVTVQLDQQGQPIAILEGRDGSSWFTNWDNLRLRQVKLSNGGWSTAGSHVRHNSTADLLGRLDSWVEPADVAPITKASISTDGVVKAVDELGIETTYWPNGQKTFLTNKANISELPPGTVSQFPVITMSEDGTITAIGGRKAIIGINGKFLNAKEHAVVKPGSRIAIKQNFPTGPDGNYQGTLLDWHFEGNGDVSLDGHALKPGSNLSVSVIQNPNLTSTHDSPVPMVKR
jgi:hypothetical protein